MATAAAPLSDETEDDEEKEDDETPCLMKAVYTHLMKQVAAFLIGNSTLCAREESEAEAMEAFLTVIIDVRGATFRDSLEVVSPWVQDFWLAGWPKALSLLVVVLCFRPFLVASWYVPFTPHRAVPLMVSRCRNDFSES
jgi:hypothetical protein